MDNLTKKDSADISSAKSHNILQDIQQIIEKSQRFAWQAVNVAMVQRNWLLGKRIAEEELQGESRAKYGDEMVKQLAAELTKLYGKGFDYSNLYKFTRFYKAFPDIFHAVSTKAEDVILDTLCPKSEDAILDTLCPKSEDVILDTACPKSEDAILDTLWTKSCPLLTWSHFGVTIAYYYK
jgi:hypothetical protein